MTARLFAEGWAENDNDRSADLFWRAVRALLDRSLTFLCKWNSSSSTPLVAGVSMTEPALLLGKGTEEGVVEAVEASFCSVAAFPLIPAMLPQNRARLTFTRQENSGLFIRGSMEDGES